MSLDPTTQFPTSLSNIPDPSATTLENADGFEHDLLHQRLNAEVEALQAKVGVDSSSVVTTLDYKLKSTSSANPGHKHTLINGATDLAAAVDLETATQVRVKTANTLNIADVSGFKIAGTAVTTSAAELNVLQGVVGGTTSASKALVVGSSKNTDMLIIDKGLKFNAPQGFLINGKITVSVSSNNLTVALKTLAGNDPSATDPVYCRIGNTVQTCTAAVSRTLAAATNWFNSGKTGMATKARDYFIYAIWNTTPATDIFDIGFAPIPYGRVYSEFSGTTTAETYLAYANGSAPQSADEVENIGRFTATLSATAAFTWSISGTGDVINHPITFSEKRTFLSVVDVSGGTTPTFGATDTGEYQIFDRTCIYDMSKTNSSGGTAGAGAAAVTFTVPIPINSSITGPIGVAQWFNNAAGEISRCKINSTTQFIVVRSTTANLIGDSLNHANTRIVEIQIMYPI